MTRPIKSLNCLAKNINKYLKTNYTHHFTLNNIRHILHNYQGNDWKDYKPLNNKSRQYLTRHQYHKIPIHLNRYENDVYDMYLIIWNPFSETPIHDHSDKGCIMKVLEGNLCEERFSVNGFQSYKNKLYPNQISYIDDYLGYHRISNNYPLYSYSLHIYSPPKFVEKISYKSLENLN